MHSTSRREFASDLRSLASSNHETPAFEASELHKKRQQKQLEERKSDDEREALGEGLEESAPVVEEVPNETMQFASTPMEFQ